MLRFETFKLESKFITANFSVMIGAAGIDVKFLIKEFR